LIKSIASSTSSFSTYLENLSLALASASLIIDSNCRGVADIVFFDDPIFLISI